MTPFLQIKSQKFTSKKSTAGQLRCIFMMLKILDSFHWENFEKLEISLRRKTFFHDRIMTKNMQLFQRYNFTQNRFYGVWSSPRPPASVGVKWRKKLTILDITDGISIETHRTLDRSPDYLYWHILRIRERADHWKLTAQNDFRVW